MRTTDRRGLIAALFVSLALLAPHAMAQSGPPLPPLPLGYPLDWWKFDDTNWLTTVGYAPMSFTNLALIPDWDNNALQVDSTNAAWLQYAVVEPDGHTNLPITYGSFRLWLLPNWSSTNQGGTGPGDWGRIIDVGAYTTNASYGWWSLHLDPSGDNLYFSAQTNNGTGTNYLTFPISWDSATWHQIALAYSPTNTALYLDGALATNGPGISIWPGPDVLSNGFFILSDATGLAQAHAQGDDLWTYNYPLDTNDIAGNYAYFAPFANPTVGGGFHPDDGGSFNFGGGGGITNDYSTNLWLWIGGVSSNFANLALVNTAADVLYEIQSLTNAAQSNWMSEGFVHGSELTNWTAMNVAQNNRPDLFLRIRSWMDSTGTGIPDWWWLEYFGQTTNVNAYAADPAGDGYTDLQKFQLGINPTNYYNPNAPSGFFGCLDTSQTNVFLEWSPSPGPVVNYLIQRGIQDTNGNYVYSQIGTVSSNAVFFEDVGAISNANAWNNIYNLEALYPGGLLTATDTWYAWYGEYGYSGAPSGAPVPGNVYAYAPSNGTNVLISWTAPTPGAAPTNYIIERGVLDTNTGNYSYSQIAAVNTNTNYFQDVHAITNANAWNDVYEIMAVFPGGVLSQPTTASISTNLPAPTGVSAAVDSTGTNVIITWTPPAGIAVSNYIIERGIFNTNTDTYSYSQIGDVSSNTTSFEDTGAITGNNSYNNVYGVEAEIPGGGVSGFEDADLPAPPAPFYDNIYLTANLIRNGNCRWQIMFSGLPTNSAQTIELTWTDGDGSSITQSISTTNLINGIYPIADTNSVNLLGWSLSVQLFGTNGEPGQPAQAGVLANDAPYFVDGRQHMEQNLNFLIRGASKYYLFSGQPEVAYSQYGGQFNQIETNFEEFSFLHHSDSSPLEDLYSFQLEALWPFEANYALADYLANTALTTGSPFGSTNFSFQPNFTNPVPAPPILDPNSDPYWILQPGFGGTTGSDPSADWALNVDVSDTNATLDSDSFNLFGLPYTNGCLIGYNSSDGIFSYQTLAPGDSISTPPGYYIFTYASWCPAPNLQFVNYYFAPLINPGNQYLGFSGVNLPGEFDPSGGSNYQPFPLPIEENFSVTNQTPSLIVGTVGQPMILAGWEKFSVSNSSPTKYAYLGQYFETNAFLLDTDGSPTTNSAGILSPYGEFFPMQAGLAELLTMVDTSTGQQGTNVVHVVSLNVDANHDGTMDLSYSGQDQTSSSRPMRFWVADDNNSGDYGGNGIPGQIGIEADGQCYSYFQGAPPYYQVLGRRHLEDFFPVYLNIDSLFQSNAFSAGISPTDTNYQFVLSQADGALRIAYTALTPTNYMNYLLDTNESGSLVNTTLTTITANGVALPTSFVNGIATASQGIILAEAWTTTTQPLVLTIYHGTNLIGQTSLYLSISSVTNMFRSKTIVLSPQLGTNADRLTDASVPNEPDTTENNFVFVHGYNVNPTQAVGWDADIYKRMYWSGSHAKFYGVTWEAADSQVDGQVTINLQTNIVNAFNTAPLLNSFLNSLSGTNIVAAHSLGNMLVLSTLNDCTNQSIKTYFMIDAAVAIEAIDTTAASNPDMYSSAWTNYNSKLWASKWFNLWPSNDARSTLTWSGRLTAFQSTDVYNFYSSGEEVLRDYPSDPPVILSTIAVDEAVYAAEGETGEYAWAWEEKNKGLMGANDLLSSDHGGWLFNNDYTSLTVAEANALPNSELQTNAFFYFSAIPGSLSPFNNDLALETSSGSSYAQTNRNRILSDAIPCLTLPVGANSVNRLAPIGQTNRNSDMQASYENGWPAGRGPAHYPVGTTAVGEWHHSDVRAVAYTFTCPLFDRIVTLGNLK